MALQELKRGTRHVQSAWEVRLPLGHKAKEMTGEVGLGPPNLGAKKRALERSIDGHEGMTFDVFKKIDESEY